MPDYQKGKIYKVYCLTGGSDDIYYGSTVQTLAQRMTKHRQGLTKKRKCNTSIIFNKFGVDNCIIELVENYPCNTVEELNAREGYYQRNNPCVNRAIAGRSSKEWTEDNRDNLNKSQRERYKNNKEQVKCECGGSYILLTQGGTFRKARHEKSKKHTDYEKSIVTGV
jgi:hypothetical protein